MRMGDEALQALEWAYGRLSGDQALADAMGVQLESLPGQLWPDVAPAETTGVWITYTVVDYQDQAAMGDADRLGSIVRLDVKATTQGRSYDALGPVARAVYQALHGRTNDPLTDGGMVLFAKRSGGIQYPEQAEGIHYRHLGHEFQVGIN